MKNGVGIDMEASTLRDNHQNITKSPRGSPQKDEEKPRPGLLAVGRRWSRSRQQDKPGQVQGLN